MRGRVESIFAPTPVPVCQQTYRGQVDVRNCVRLDADAAHAADVHRVDINGVGGDTELSRKVLKGFESYLGLYPDLVRVFTDYVDGRRRLTSAAARAAAF